jgi:predicted RNase H-like nuclease (RuvC/YqgF family)
MRLFALSDVAKDASTLETIIQQAENFLPSLREEHAQVIRELEQEQSITAEIENCDQEYLRELKVTLAEQGYCRTFTARSGNNS